MFASKRGTGIRLSWVKVKQMTVGAFLRAFGKGPLAPPGSRMLHVACLFCNFVFHWTFCYQTHREKCCSKYFLFAGEGVFANGHTHCFLTTSAPAPLPLHPPGAGKASDQFRVLHPEHRGVFKC